MEIKGIGLVTSKLKNLDNKINVAASNAVNRTATRARQDAVDILLTRVTLKRSYIAKHIKVVGRSSPDTLRAVIHSTARATLLDRFASVKVKGGVKVRINRSGGYKTINGAFRVRNLRGSHSTGIAITNVAAARYYKDKAIQSGHAMFSTLASKAAAKAVSNPGGIHVLHSMSVNQMFNAAKPDIKDGIQAFMQQTFLRSLSNA